MAFKHQLSIVDAQFLALHLIGKNTHQWIYYRNPERDWYSNYFFPKLDDYATKILGQDPKNHHYWIANTEFEDEYVNIILSNFAVDTKETWDENRNTIKLNSLVEDWKTKVLDIYSREDHIKYFTWRLLRGVENQAKREKVYSLIRDTLSLKNSFSFDDFTIDGMAFTIIHYGSSSKSVRLNSINGLFSHFTRYGYHKTVIPNSKIVDIPSSVYLESVGEMTIREIGPSVFDNLTNTEIIKLPSSLTIIDWSFWRCSALKSIEIKSPASYLKFQSINGVLYSSDRKILYAYPNDYGETYTIPEGVEEIHKFAFKSCSKLKELYIPSTLRKIGINAFYRCSSLQRIICNMPSQMFTFDGFQGDYQPFSPKWFFYKDIYPVSHD